jgi:pyridoxamine-phosphate oxidase
MFRLAFTHTLRSFSNPRPVTRSIIMTDYVAGALSKVGINAKSSTTNSYSSTTQGAQGAKEDENQNATEILTHNQYKTSGLERDALSPSALTQFRTWFQDAIDHPEIPEPEAMTISTVSVQEGENGKSIARPSSRIVLLKRVDKRGFIFFTNYNSRKGIELERNPFIALTFYWHALHRSVRVCGKVEKLSNDENDQYFNSRKRYFRTKGKRSGE